MYSQALNQTMRPDPLNQDIVLLQRSLGLKGTQPDERSD